MAMVSQYNGLSVSYRLSINRSTGFDSKCVSKLRSSALNRLVLNIYHIDNLLIMYFHYLLYSN